MGIDLKANIKQRSAETRPGNLQQTLELFVVFLIRIQPVLFCADLALCSLGTRKYQIIIQLSVNPRKRALNVKMVYKAVGLQPSTKYLGHVLIA